MLGQARILERASQGREIACEPGGSVRRALALNTNLISRRSPLGFVSWLASTSGLSHCGRVAAAEVPGLVTLTQIQR